MKAARACFAFTGWAVLIGWLVSAPASAQPLDLADPTPRAIRVEFEISTHPGTFGQTYSEPFAATYSAAGNLGTVVIASAVYEAAIQTHELDYFDTMLTGSLISGSASDFTLAIDLTTLEATASPLDYRLLITSPVPFPQEGTVTRNVSTTTIAGFGLLPQYPGFPFFCAACTPVPGAAYDASTGRLHAIGSDELVAPDIPGLIGFARAGDLRLSEDAAQAVPGLSGYGLWGLAFALMGAAFLTTRTTGMLRRS